MITELKLNFTNIVFSWFSWTKHKLDQNFATTSWANGDPLLAFSGLTWVNSKNIPQISLETTNWSRR